MSENEQEKRTGVVFPYEEINLDKSGNLYLANVLIGEVEEVDYRSFNDYDNLHYALDFDEVKEKGWLFYDEASARKHLVETVKRNQSQLFKGLVFPILSLEEIKGEVAWAAVDYEEKRVEMIQAWLVKQKPALLQEFACFNTKEEAEAFIKQQRVNGQS